MMVAPQRTTTFDTDLATRQRMLSYLGTVPAPTHVAAKNSCDPRIWVQTDTNVLNESMKQNRCQNRVTH